MPALVNRPGKAPTLKLGAAGAPVTLAVNWSRRNRTRLVVTASGGPGVTELTFTCTCCPGISCDVSPSGFECTLQCAWNRQPVRVYLKIRVAQAYHDGV